jgi:hypothetical protein
MDNLINYTGFRQDIEAGFSDLIRDFNLEIITPYEGCYILHGEKCNIKFVYDRGDLDCGFLQISDSIYQPSYHVGLVCKYLYPQKEPTINDSINRDNKTKISGYAKIITLKLQNVLGGDFTWLADFLTEQNRINKLYAFAFKNFDGNNPILKKFWSNDESWQDDLKNYLKQNNIII